MYVYIMTNKNNTVLYVGVTNDLLRRTWEHKNNILEGFSKQYNLHKLVYFETFPEARKKVIYPFGFGLSYTDFEIQAKALTVGEEEIKIKVEVTNLGQREGKEVVQIYYSAPQGKLGKPALELGAFQKTGKQA